MAGLVESVNTSRGGVPKASVFEAHIGTSGVSGDRQDDDRHHGGPDRAVVIFSLDVIQALRREGHPIAAGSTGENLTISGIDWPSLVPGATLAIGDARLLITKYATPCSKIRHSFVNEHFMRIAQDRHPGWSRLCARVLQAGIVRRGDEVRVELPAQAR